MNEQTQPNIPAPQQDPVEEEPLVDIMQQELESILPFSARAKEAITWMGEISVLAVRALQRTFTPPFGIKDTAYQLEVLGVGSLALGALVAVFAGLVISLQFAFFMARFGIQHTVGRVVVLTLFRELAPVLTALTVGARIGSGITAELGSMKVTEQIDAIKALGADPVKKLISPRLIACCIVLPALTALSDVLGLLAGSLVVKAQYDIPLEQFYRSAVETASMLDFTSGIFKAAVFGFIIAIVGCHKGFTVVNGTEGVGRATTETVAIASVGVLLADFVLTTIIMSIAP